MISCTTRERLFCLDISGGFSDYILLILFILLFLRNLIITMNLENIGINVYQGFLFEKPLPYDQFILKHTQGWRMVK